MPAMTARSVVLSVLLGAHPAWATASELIQLTADFGIKETTLRVALTRMVGAGDLVGPRTATGSRIGCWPASADKMRPCAHGPALGTETGTC